MVYSRMKVVVIPGSVNAVVRPVACRYRFDGVAVGRTTVVVVEEQDEIPGHSVGGLDVKMEVGRNLGLRKSKQDYKKEGRRERKFKRKFFFSLCISVV